MKSSTYAEIITTIWTLADEYGVDRPGDADDAVKLYRDSDGWHISHPWLDAEWAPTSDAHAAELAAAMTPDDMCD